MYENLTAQAKECITEFMNKANFKDGSLLIIGCSSSEIMGVNIGKGSAPVAAAAVLAGLRPVLREHGAMLAAQCCEHLNRALVMERADAEKLGCDLVCVRPRPKAGGSFATAVYESMTDPVVVETVKAPFGLDIGSTMIGMHLKPVAVPVRLDNRKLGEATVTGAYSRAKLIGGARADYPEK